MSVSQMEHTPLPFGIEEGETSGGGIRCSCGKWEARVQAVKPGQPKRGMAWCWDRYREHWSRANG